jgi:hypothetical protein
MEAWPVRFWTWQFVGALAVVAALVVDARWYGPDPFSGQPRHLFPFTDTGVAPFVFLLSLLYVFSHAGGWVLAVFRKRGERQEPPRQGKKR